MVTPSFISTAQQLSDRLLLQESEKKAIEKVAQVYPFRIPEFYAALMDRENPVCPIRLQAVPSIQELKVGGVPDPLGEAAIRVTPSFLKRYPRRGVFLVSSECAMYCRFCNRKRAVGKGHAWEQSTEETLRYLEKDEEVSEVILSGGDPMMLAPERLAYILERLRSNKRIDVVRVSTRFPVVFPEGIQREHLKAIRKHAPIWVITHINHPKEVTSQFAEVVNMLRKAGAVLISQTVLLRGVNDCPHILSGLFERLVRLGVKPYYLFQLDDAQGAQHFKVRLSAGVALMRELRRDISGLCIPQYALDITGGVGKVPLETTYVGKRKGKSLSLRNPAGETGTYTDDGQKSRCSNCGLCQGNKAAGKR
ncbi:MAG: KamA family radical SAM protein [Syntrophorhabdales bacterium]